MILAPRSFLVKGGLPWCLASFGGGLFWSKVGTLPVGGECGVNNYFLAILG